MEREACVCDHGYERSDLCAEIIIIINKIWLSGRLHIEGRLNEGPRLQRKHKIKTKTKQKKTKV